MNDPSIALWKEKWHKLKK